MTCVFPQQLFSPPLADYAFLIHLDASHIPRHFQSLAPEAAALAPRTRSSVLSGSMMGDLDDEDDDIRVGWDPVADLVKRLRVRHALLRRLSLAR